jgi:hypothetical protein
MVGREGSTLYRSRWRCHEDATAENGASAPAEIPTLSQVVEALKQEKSYLNWSLENAVEEQLIRLHRHRCSYSHVIAKRTAGGAALVLRLPHLLKKVALRVGS